MEKFAKSCPEDALGSIARAQQLVVVGNPKQSPPDFFKARIDRAFKIDSEDEADVLDDASIKAARDRDRLRQQVLERLGWTLYRICSTDWFSNPSGETEKLITFIQTIQSQQE